MDLIESYREELQLIRKPWTRVWVGAFVLCLLLLPWFAPEHLVYIATIIFIYSIGAQGQNLLIGYTGQISFGQAGFLAIGAFTFGHINQAGLPWPVGVLAAGLTAGIFGVLVERHLGREQGRHLDRLRASRQGHARRQHQQRAAKKMSISQGWFPR